MIEHDCTCLGRDCLMKDQCLRHVAIRNRQPPPDDRQVELNACRVDDGAFLDLPKDKKS